jgi:hypothetical protein
LPVRCTREEIADLWKLLVVSTPRKAADLRAHKKRGGAERGESALLMPGDDGETKRSIEEVIGAEPTPDCAAQVGCTSAEIAARLGCSLCSVQRKLELIRCTWKEHGLA